MEKGKFLAISLVVLLPACATPYRPPTEPPPEEWTGESGWTVQAENVRVRDEGGHHPGDVLLEYPVKMRRTAVVVETVQTKNAYGRDFILPEGTKLFAANFKLTSGQAIDPIEWCAVLPHGVDGKQKGSDTACLFWESPTRARYKQDYRDGGFAFHPRMITANGMEGPVPRIKVQPVDFGVQIVSQLRVVRFDKKSVQLEEVLSDGAFESRIDSHSLRWDSNRKASYKDVVGEFELTASETYSSVQFAQLRRAPAPPIVRVCVDSAGALSGEPQIVVTSGRAQLDTAAIDIAKKGRYAPGQGNDGADCFKFKVRFDLREE
jgi:hypothetical protein